MIVQTVGGLCRARLVINEHALSGPVIDLIKNMLMLAGFVIRLADVRATGTADILMVR